VSFMCENFVAHSHPLKDYDVVLWCGTGSCVLFQCEPVVTPVGAGAVCAAFESLSTFI
jgi:hypothetical protein